MRKPDVKLTLANFMRIHLLSCLASLKPGFDILDAEHVLIETMYAHGGYFKTPGVGQAFLAAAVKAPVCVMETAGEGGPWGMALLAAYLNEKEERESLEDFLKGRVFASHAGDRLEPEAADIEGLSAFLKTYDKALAVEKAAVEYF